MSFLIIANMFWKIYDVKFNTLWVNQTINVILFDQVNEWFSQLNKNIPLNDFDSKITS